MRFVNYLHRQAPVDSLALYRILIATLICLEAAGWLPYARELFSNQGFHIPNATWMPAPTPIAAYALCLMLVIAAFSMAIGFMTRYAIAVTWLIWIYFYSLDSINEKAAQTIAIIALAVLFFSACGNRLSLDNFLRRKRGLPELPGQASVFPQRLLQFEFAQIYFFSGVSKLMNPDWVNGNAFYYILNGRWATGVGIFVSSMHPNIIARAAGLGTILFELFIGVLLFIPPIRPVAIAAGVVFHSGIQMTLWVGTLGFHFISALISLFPQPETVEKRIRDVRGFLKRML